MDLCILLDEWGSGLLAIANLYASQPEALVRFSSIWQNQEMQTHICALNSLFAREVRSFPLHLMVAAHVPCKRWFASESGNVLICHLYDALLLRARTGTALKALEFGPSPTGQDQRRHGAVDSSRVGAVSSCSSRLVLKCILVLCAPQGWSVFLAGLAMSLAGKCVLTLALWPMPSWLECLLCSQTRMVALTLVRPASQVPVQRLKESLQPLTMLVSWLY